jgi:hypothetical protein
LIFLTTSSITKSGTRNHSRGTTGWFRGHLSKERLATKDAQVDLARSQRDDLSIKLTEALAKLSEAQGQIAGAAGQAGPSRSREKVSSGANFIFAFSDAMS